MKDKSYQLLLNQLTKAHAKYLALLNKAEEEYKRRFGNYPADVDDDWWIDSFCQSAKGSSLEDVIKNAQTKFE